MAKKRRPSPLEEPPTASSSSDSDEEQQPSSQPQEDEVVEEEQQASGEEDEGEEEDEDEEEEDDDEEDQPPASSQPTPKNPPPASANSHPKSSSSSESGSDDESESDEAPPPANSKVKPLASKPMDQNPKTKAQAQAQSSPPPTRSGTKRAVENNNSHVKDPKRAKKKATDTAGGGSDEEMEEDDDGKKSVDDSKKTFQRVWSEEDELTIVKGLADFISRSGNDPVKHITAFYDIVKKSLHFDASCNQLRQKVRRLKEKFKANAEKGKNGEDPVFSKPHDQKLFELSKKVWGNGPNEAEEKGKPNGKPPKSPKKEASRKNAASAKKQPPAKKPPPETKEEPNPPAVVALKEPGEVETDNKVGDSSFILSEMFRFDKCVGLNGLSEDVVKRGVEMIGESKRAELEGRWKKLQVAELELFVKRAQLIEDQARLILEAYKSSDH